MNGLPFNRDESASATFYLRERSSTDACEEECDPLEEVWIYNKAPKPGSDEFPLRFEQVRDWIVGKKDAEELRSKAVTETEWQVLPKTSLGPLPTTRRWECRQRSS